MEDFALLSLIHLHRKFGAGDPELYRSGRNAPSSFSIVIDKYHTVTINDRLRR
jgi:hypothetical protein